MSNGEILFQSASDLLKEVRNESVTVLEVVDELLERIEKVNPKINAVVYLDKKAVLKQAREADRAAADRQKLGPLHGLPVTIKDNIETAGLVTTGGITGRKAFVPSFDASVVTRLKKAGAIIVGKTNCPAFCAGWETTNEVYGRTSNPYDLTRTVGSSSGGEAALIASGGSFVGLGSDTGGSIRWPASFCGVAGLVPTFGRVPRTGTIPPYLGFLDTTQIGPIARSIEDLALILAVIAGPDGFDPRCVPMTHPDLGDVPTEKTRVAYYAGNGFVEPDSAVTDTVHRAADALAGEGVDVEERVPKATEEFLSLSKSLNSFADNIEPDTQPDSQDLQSPVELFPSEIHRVVDRLVSQSQDAKAVNDKNAMLGVEFFYWGMKLDSYRTKIVGFLAEFDAIVCPVSARPAFSHGAPTSESFAPLDYLSYTHPYSLVGLPSVTVRGGTSPEGMPIGVQVITAHGREALAMKIGHMLEHHLGGWHPPRL